MARSRLLGCLVAAAASLGMAAPAHAGVINVRMPFDLEFPACNGETVLASGVWHIVARTDEVNGEEIVIGQHTNLQGFRGVGLETGEEYVVSQSGNTSMHPSFDAASPLTITSDLHVIDPGSGENFLLHALVHITFNANGEVTSFQNKGRLDCRG